jgi:hypothetical protein
MTHQKRTQAEILAEAIRAVGISLNIPDDNLEPANIVDVVCYVARAINKLAAAVEDHNDILRGGPKPAEPPREFKLMSCAELAAWKPETQGGDS